MKKLFLVGFTLGILLSGISANSAGFFSSNDLEATSNTIQSLSIPAQSKYDPQKKIDASQNRVTPNWGSAFSSSVPNSESAQKQSIQQNKSRWGENTAH